MPGCAGRRGSGLGTSSRRSNERDSVFRAALIRSIRRLGDHFGLEMPDENERCDSLRRVYKRCVIEELINCDYYAKELTKICPGFNDEEFLRAVSSSKKCVTVKLLFNEFYGCRAFVTWIGKKNDGV